MKKRGIIEETGGILGIGKTKKLSSNLNPDYFVSTDVTQTSIIPIQEKIDDVEIISPHRRDSYQLIPKSENETLLEVTNPESFWQIKHLVVLVKN